MDLGDIFSTAVAFFALAYAIVDGAITRGRLKPFERPILTFDGARVQRYDGAKEGVIDVRLNWWLKNVGKRPAGRIEVEMVIGKPEIIHRSVRRYVNALGPEQEHVEFVEYSHGGVLLDREEGKIAGVKGFDYILLRVKYADGLNERKRFVEDFWYTYHRGEATWGALVMMTEEDVELFRKYADESNET